MDDPILRTQLLESAMELAKNRGFLLTADAERTLNMMLIRAQDVTLDREEEVLRNMLRIIEKADSSPIGRRVPISGHNVSTALAWFCPIWPFC